jgi:hypothetical protein
MAGEVGVPEKGKNRDLRDRVSVVGGLGEELVAVLQRPQDVAKEHGHGDGTPPRADKGDVLERGYRVAKHAPVGLIVQSAVGRRRAIEGVEYLAQQLGGECLDRCGLG